jgi:hypothetical protein
MEHGADDRGVLKALFERFDLDRVAFDREAEGRHGAPDDLDDALAFEAP